MTTATLTKGAAETLERDARGRIRLTAASERNISVQLTLFVLAALTVVTFARMGYGTVDLVQAARQALADFGAMMLQPALDPPLGASHFTWATVLESAVITVAVTAICTVLSAIVSFFLALAASANLSNPAVSNAVKGFVAIIRLRITPITPEVIRISFVKGVTAKVQDTYWKPKADTAFPSFPPTDRKHICR